MLHDLRGEKTVIIIAHRMSTIRHADFVVALEGGKVAEQGAPEELIEKNAAFARLYRLEAEAFLKAERPAPFAPENAARKADGTPAGE
jgi:ABC-type multidrug transport system fused ATPase/permease subunit